MNRFALMCAGVLLCGTTLAPGALADGRNPGSALVYPVHRSRSPLPEDQAKDWFVIMSTTNTKLSGQDTDLHYYFVNVTPKNPKKPDLVDVFCMRNNFIDQNFTVRDTRSILTSCVNGGPGGFGVEGYAVVVAQDPAGGLVDFWKYDYLVGSEIVVGGLGVMYSINAIPFLAGDDLDDFDLTDLDCDEQLDFDGMEYEGVPDELYIDTFLAAAQSSVVLIDFSGGPEFVTTVTIDIFNDNEFALSATGLSFRCWIEEGLIDVSSNFSEAILKNNMQDDPNDLDTDCVNGDDLETGWAIVRGLAANSQNTTINDPAILGAIVAGDRTKPFIDGGHLLWESPMKQDNGNFLHFGANLPPDDPNNCP